MSRILKHAAASVKKFFFCDALGVHQWKESSGTRPDRNPYYRICLRCGNIELNRAGQWIDINME